jgi:hypothetical protein
MKKQELEAVWQAVYYWAEVGYDPEFREEDPMVKQMAVLYWYYWGEVAKGAFEKYVAGIEKQAKANGNRLINKAEVKAEYIEKYMNWVREQKEYAHMNEIYG